MNIENRLIFVARPGGKTDTVCRAFMGERVAAHAKRREYAESKGARGTYGSDGGVIGLVYLADQVPSAWRVSNKYGAGQPGLVVVIPDLKKKETGKALKAELEALPSLPYGWDLDNRLGFGGMLSGHSILFANVAPVGDQVVVTVPRYDKVEKDGELPVEDLKGNSNQFIPEDCDQIKTSEYFALVEAQEAKAK